MRVTKEEKEIREAFRKGEIEYLPRSGDKKYQEWAQAQAKDQAISIRINGFDLMKLQWLAKSKGKKYQTYIGEILKREIFVEEAKLEADYRQKASRSRKH